jgi:broad specificity phosphatase PhoE
MLRTLRLMLAAVLLPLGSGCAPALAPAPVTGPAAVVAPPTTVYVFRHAERASEEDRDSPLSESGWRRAEALADALAGAGVQAIYTTQYLRTRETARPLAERLGLQVRPDTTRGGPDPARELARRVLAVHPGGTVLIVGHSNTVPAIVEALGGPALAELDASRYGDLFIVTVTAGKPVRTVRAQVGGAGDPRLPAPRP